MTSPVADRLDRDATGVLRELAHAGILFDELTARLLSDGIDDFSDSLDALLDSAQQSRRDAVSAASSRRTRVTQ